MDVVGRSRFEVVDDLSVPLADSRSVRAGRKISGDSPPSLFSLSTEEKSRRTRARRLAICQVPSFSLDICSWTRASHIIEYLSSSSSSSSSFVSRSGGPWQASARGGEGGRRLRRGFRFQNDWGEIGVSRYRLATLDVISSRA